MSFDKFEKDSYCVGGRHRSATQIFMVIQRVKVVKS